MFATVFLVLFVVLLVLLLCRNQRPKNFPPGPRTVPLFGNLLQLDLENPLADFDRLAKRYGNVYSIFMGPKPCVVLNGFQAIKEALVSRAADFSGRPQHLFVSQAVGVKAHAPGVILADYSPGWKEQRRFGLMTLRNCGLGKQPMEERILKEISHLTKLLEESEGRPMDPQLLFHNASANIICQVLFAKHFDYDDEMMQFFVQLFHETSKIINGRWDGEFTRHCQIYDFVPLVRSLPLPFQRAFELFKGARARHFQIFTQLKQNRVPGKPQHFIDCYLDELDKRGDDSSSFSEEQLCAFLLDLHFAGTDTTANTLLTAILYLMNYPHVQDRCHQEIDSVLGDKDKVSFEDRHQMPYVQAVIHEVQRVADTVPLSVFHCTTKDTEVMGYSLPKGTVVIPNLSSALFEEGQWKSPRDFNPENFLDDHGGFVKPEAFVPFSTGSRMCLGEGLARMELFLIVVTLLRKFQFIWPEDAGQPDFTLVFGTTQTPKPYRMVIQLRTDSRH